jgi:hypothetical protein
MPSRHALVVSLILAGVFAVWHAHAADEVTIYRCVDAKGRESLQDTPCAKHQTQKEARTMARPRDAAPRPVQPAPVREPAPPRTERVTYASPPRPLYECITPDDMRYTSDTNDGNPRWVPLWTLGYPVFPVIAGSTSGVNFTLRNNNVVVSGGHQIVQPQFYSPAAYGGGTWVRDTCFALPQADVCDRVRDRRDEIRRRFFNAMPSERDVLRVEERSLNARLDADCG